MAQTSSNLVDIPSFTGYVDQRFFIEPLGGPEHPYNYLDRFPESIYNLGPYSHLVKFLYALVGPSGVGGMRQNYLKLRLELEEQGFELFDLDSLYGDPFKFGRIASELYTDDISALLTYEQRSKIAASDASYRSRAQDFMNAARAGTSPLGMRLAARSGLNHEVEIVENYKWLFDQHTDRYLGLPYYGRTQSTEEFIVLPRRSISRSAVQMITLTGNPTDGFLSLNFNGQQTGLIAFDASADTVEGFLEALPNIGTGNVRVNDGPGPERAYEVQFIGQLSGIPVPLIEADNELTGTTPVSVEVVMTTGGVDSSDEATNISPIDQHHLQVAMDRLSPVASIQTTAPANGLRTRQPWRGIWASSEFAEHVKFITPTKNPTYIAGVTDWMHANIEHQAPQLVTGGKHHYIWVHHIAQIWSYSDQAIDVPEYGGQTWPLQRKNYSSEHIGPYNQWQRVLFPFMKAYTNPQEVFSVDRAIANQNTQLSILEQNTTRDGNQIFMTDRGLPHVLYNDRRPSSPPVHWSSRERIAGDEYLEIDLGKVLPVNYISFETTRKPIFIELEFDLLDMAPQFKWFPVRPWSRHGYSTQPYEQPVAGVRRKKLYWWSDENQRYEDNIANPNYPFTDEVTYSPDMKNPWTFAEFDFINERGQMIYTRMIRIRFIRNPANNPFDDGIERPWSVDVRSLRVGRIASD